MKIIFTILIFIFTATVVQSQTDGFVKSYFTSKQMNVANVARNTAYLTKNEKKVIQYINLARKYPKEFTVFYIDYLSRYDVEGYRKYESKDEYYYGLVKYLKKVKPKKTPLLHPNKLMYELAKCWAIESGKKGVIGHDRKHCSKNYAAECCNYRQGINAMEHVIDLLVDENVKGQGHREILLSKEYTRVGVSFYSHKEYGNCLVMDFEN